MLVDHATRLSLRLAGRHSRIRLGEDGEGRSGRCFIHRRIEKCIIIKIFIDNACAYSIARHVLEGYFVGDSILRVNVLMLTLNHEHRSHIRVFWAGPRLDTVSLVFPF